MTLKRYEEYYRHCIRFRIVCMVRLTEHDLHPPFWKYHYGNAPVYVHHNNAFSRIWKWFAHTRKCEQIIKDMKLPTEEEYYAGKRVDLVYYKSVYDLYQSEV